MPTMMNVDEFLYDEHLPYVDPRHDPADTWAKSVFNKHFERLYPFQKEVFGRAWTKNSIVCLPTGAGKTEIAGCMAALQISRFPEKKIVFVVNRIPLIQQQATVLQRFGLRVAQVCGGKREASSWDDFCHRFDAVVIMDALLREWISASTAHALFSRCSLLVLDEIHHAKKQSNYAKILKMVSLEDSSSRTSDHADRYESSQSSTDDSRPRIWGLTASPGARENEEKTRCALEELVGLTKCRLVTVLEQTDDLRRIVPTPSSELFEYFPHPLEDYWTEVFDYAINHIETVVIPSMRKFDCSKRITRLETCAEQPRGTLQYIARAHDVALAATQAGDTAIQMTAVLLGTLNECLILLEERATRDAARRLMAASELLEYVVPKEPPRTLDEFTSDLEAHLRHQLNKLMAPILATIVTHCQPGGTLSHPRSFMSTKMMLLVDLLEEQVNNFRNPDFRGIVFCQTKQAVLELTRLLWSKPLGQMLRPKYFVGRGKSLIREDDDASTALSMTDKQQQRAIAEFREGTTQLLIATSVAEEGLDIPECNLVVRYEGFFSVQSFIQSRGRARKPDSRYLILTRADTGSKRVLGVLRECRIQDQCVKSMCLSNQDHIIERCATSSLRACDVDPVKFLKQVELNFNASIHQEETVSREGTRIVVACEFPNGSVFTGYAVGNRQDATQRAYSALLHDLEAAGYLEPSAALDAKAVQATSFPKWSFVKDGVALTRENAEDSAYLMEYETHHWGARDDKPFYILGKHLRKRKLPAPRWRLAKQNGMANGAVTGQIEFTLRDTRGEHTYSISGSGANAEEAMQNAAMAVLRSLGVHVVEMQQTTAQRW